MSSSDSRRESLTLNYLTVQKNLPFKELQGFLIGLNKMWAEPAGGNSSRMYGTLNYGAFETGSLKG